MNELLHDLCWWPDVISRYFPRTALVLSSYARARRNPTTAHVEKTCSTRHQRMSTSFNTNNTSTKAYDVANGRFLKVFSSKMAISFFVTSQRFFSLWRHKKISILVSLTSISRIDKSYLTSHSQMKNSDDFAPNQDLVVFRFREPLSLLLVSKRIMMTMLQCHLSPYRYRITHAA